MSQTNEKITELEEKDRLTQEEYLTDIVALEDRVKTLEDTVSKLLQVMTNMNYYYMTRKELEQRLPSSP